MEIKECCLNIYKILNEFDETEWAEIFKNFIYKIDNDGEKNVSKEILSIYKGFGSFNDLVLYKNGILSFTKNEELDSLRRKLFASIISIL